MDIKYYLFDVTYQSEDMIERRYPVVIETKANTKASLTEELNIALYAFIAADYEKEDFEANIFEASATEIDEDGYVTLCVTVRPDLSESSYILDLKEIPRKDYLVLKQYMINMTACIEKYREDFLAFLTKFKLSK